MNRANTLGTILVDRSKRIRVWSMSVVCRLEDASDSIIRTVSGIPNVAESRGTQGLGRLHASGWMEDALVFAEGNDAEYSE